MGRHRPTRHRPDLLTLAFALLTVAIYAAGLYALLHSPMTSDCILLPRTAGGGTTCD